MFARITTLSLIVYLLVACGSTTTLTAPASTPVASLQTISISTAWVRSSPSGDNSAAYMTITNSGVADTLIAATGDFAMMIELHTITNNDGVMNMHPAKNGIPIPANGTQILKSGGFHVMIMGLSNPLTSGQTIPITLTFANAGSVVVPFEVR